MAQSMALDIHSFAKQYESTERHLLASSISARNKELILRFRDVCLLRGVCAKVRLIRAMIVLGRCATILGKDFDTVNRQDVERVITTLMNEGLLPNTLSTYKSILKRFLSYVFAPDDFPNAPIPPPVAWVRTHVRRAELRRLQRNDLVTPDDIQKLLRVCRSTRDKALISMLWETGSRIAELGNLQLRHVTKTAHGYALDLDGKTGRRTPLVVSSAPYLSQWLANHPFKDNPDSPLWVHNQYDKTPRHLKYDTIAYLLKQYFAHAGINKPYHPHIFRHSRATYLLAKGLMNESMAKSYFGWTPDSGMLGTYSHLVDQDANNAILRENNLEPPREHHDDLKPVVCHACNELNPPATEYCTKCTAILDLKRAYEHQHAQQLHDDLSMTIVKLLVDKGLLDEAAKAVHDAGLGSALKRLAEQSTTTGHATTTHAHDQPPAAAPAENRG
jgi:integrase/ribosomal protein L40E